MSEHDWTVILVDDDPGVRDALSLLVGAYGYRTMTFASAESFQRAFANLPERSCLILDIRMPGMDGLALQKWLKESGCLVPVIIMTGHGDIGTAREAFRAEAVDFLEKPLDHDRLLQAIEEGRQRQAALLQVREHSAEVTKRLEALTGREVEVMNLVVAGLHNRDVADQLEISPRTVEVHKARVLQKLGVDSVAQLVRIVIDRERSAS